MCGSTATPTGFFFSSRRRHTRCSRDWSSDVCSCDLRGNADYFITVRSRADSFPDGIDAGEKLLHQVRADEADRGAVLLVCFGQEAAHGDVQAADFGIVGGHA